GVGIGRPTQFWTALAQTAAEHRVGREGNDPARARKRARHQEGRRRVDGHQPARPLVLPREISTRLALWPPQVTHFSGRLLSQAPLKGATVTRITRLLFTLAAVFCIASSGFAQDDDAVLQPAEPDFTVVNLPTSLRLPHFKSAFRVTHRFLR